MGYIKEVTSYSLLAVEKSRGCLLLVSRDDIDSKEFTIYEMVKGCPVWTVRRRKIHILDPPAGIFANHLTSLFECDFVSLDSRLNSKSTMDHSFGSAEEVDHVRILQSCNGLLLCSGSAWPLFYYVYNPSINLFKRPLILENQVTTKWCKLEAKLVRLGFKFTLQRQGIKASAETGSATSVLIILKVQSIGMMSSIG
ncbi:hypothetical protein Tco_0047797 [Tanacetum coccineum]